MNKFILLLFLSLPFWFTFHTLSPSPQVSLHFVTPTSIQIATLESLPKPSRSPAAIKTEIENSYKLLASKIVPSQKDDTFFRIRLIQTKEKYPLTRIQETLRWSNPASKKKALVIKAESMVGDHLMVQLKEGKNEEHLKIIVDEIGAQIRKKLKAKDLYLVSFEATDLESFNAIKRALLSYSDTILTSEPDFLLRI